MLPRTPASMACRLLFSIPPLCSPAPSRRIISLPRSPAPRGSARKRRFSQFLTSPSRGGRVLHSRDTAYFLPPSPRWGEGWGEGVTEIAIKLPNPPPPDWLAALLASRPLPNGER